LTSDLFNAYVVTHWFSVFFFGHCVLICFLFIAQLLLFHSWRDLEFLVTTYFKSSTLSQMFFLKFLMRNKKRV